MLQWMDNFQNYGIGSASEPNLSNGVYTDITSNARAVTDPDPNVSTPVMQTTNIGRFRKVLTTERATIGLAFRVFCSSLPTTSNTFAVFFADASNAAHCTLHILTTGALAFYRGATLLGQTDGPAITTSSWQHLEMKVHIDAVAGSFELRVDGVPVMVLEDINTKGAAGATIAQLLFGRSGSLASSVTTHMKDLAIWDTTGTRNNNFLGSCSVVSLRPDGDVDLGGWLPSTGATGFNLINQAVPNDATFVSAENPPPAASVFSLSNLPEEVTSVRGLMTLVRTRKTDGGDAFLQTGLRSAAAIDTGADRPITPSFTYWFDISEEDPNTSGPWSPGAVDAANVQLDRTV
jgi:hypothetical protein